MSRREGVASVSEGRRVAQNSALLGLGQAAAMAIGFATTLAVTDQLGREYGAFLGAQRFVGLFVIVVDFGLTPLLVRAVAARPEQAGVLFGTVATLRLVLAVVFGLLVALGAWGVDYLPEHRPLLWAFVAMNVLAIFAATFTGLFEGFERMGRSALTNLARAGATLLGVVGIALAGGGIYGMVLAYIGAALVQLLAAALLSRGLVARLGFEFGRDRITSMLFEAPLFVAVGLCFTALRSLDVVMLSRLATTEQVSQYGAAINFVDVMLIVPLLVQRALLPAFSRLDLAGDAQTFSRDALQVFSALLTPSAVGMILLAPAIVGLYPSGEFTAAGPILRVLAGVLLFLGPSAVCATYLTGIGRLGWILAAYALALPVQVTANWLLIPEFGAEGVARATVLAHGTLAIALLAILRAQGIRPPLAAFARHALVAAAMGAAIWPLRELPLPVPVVAGLAVYVTGLFVLSRPGDLERRLLGLALESFRRS